MFLIAFLSLKQAKNEGELDIIHGKARLKLNYMKNPSFGELRSLCQINQVCKEENQRRNLTFNNFAWLCEILQDCEIPKRSACCRIETKAMKNEFCNLAKFSQPCEIVKNKFYDLAKPKLKKMNFATPCEIFANHNAL